MTEFSLSWPAAETMAGLLVILGAGVVRGFAGFGFSAITVAGFSVFTSPAEIVPVALVLEVLASISLIKAASREADKGWLAWLIGLNLLCVPIGILILAVSPETILRLVVGVALFTTALLLRVFEGYSVAPGVAMRAFTGTASGLMNGVAASGGVTGAMLMTAARLPPMSLRATMIAYLIFAGPYTLVCAALVPGRAHVGTTLLNASTLGDAALFAPAMIIGIWIGKHMFSGTDPTRYRHFVLHLLIVLSGLGVGRAVFDLLSR
ncbi:MAG: sulfite exporter TauE/SafE family protein [Burkholderiales bacterium]